MQRFDNDAKNDAAVIDCGFVAHMHATRRVDRTRLSTVFPALDPYTERRSAEEPVATLSDHTRVCKPAVKRING